MTINETVRQKVADWRPGEGRSTLTIPDDGSGWSVAVTADRREELGCLLWDVSLSSAERPDATLGDWADQIAGRVSGLLEALKVIEVDGMRNEAILRSDKPAVQGEQVAYYEALLTGTTRGTFRRYQASHQGTERREQIPFALTHEVLAKLVGDLAGQ